MITYTLNATSGGTYRAPTVQLNTQIAMRAGCANVAALVAKVRAVGLGAYLRSDVPTVFHSPGIGGRPVTVSLEAHELMLAVDEDFARAIARGHVRAVEVAS